jgi:homing endonuclease-like protein
MFHPIEGGSVEEIQGLKCWIPPQPAVHLIDGYNKPLKEQKWVRPELPEEWEEWKEEEEQMIELNPDFVHPQRQEFVLREWERRINGYWFYNHGKATYLTGKHYFYVGWWKLDSGYAEYRDTDRKIFYFWQYCIEDPNCYGMVEMTMRRQGKCFGINTPIRMYDGSVKMVQDIIDGDLIMGNDSAPRIASGCISGKEEMFIVSPHKGSSFVCNRSHILSLIYNNNAPCVSRGWAPKSVVNISVDDYLNCTNTEKDHLVLYRSGWGDHYKSKKHKISPYVIGAWLGDGHKHGAKFSSNDHEIINAFKELAIQEKLILKHIANYDYSIVLSMDKNHDGPHVTGATTNPVKDELIRLGVLNNKHIPSDYLIDSTENRLELLAGLLDTDGHLCKNRKGVPSSYEITQKNELLSYGIVELARSLGFYTSISTKNATLKREGMKDYICLVYRIRIYGNLEKIPCRVIRKKALTNSRRVNSLHTGFKIESLGTGDYYGFSVDDNNLFLLADGMVVHNTYRGASEMYEEISKPPGKQSGGIQSKTGSDAGELFEEKIIEPWKDLPDFFKPESNSGTDPKKVLSFRRDTVRGKGAKKRKQDEDEELRSFIDWKPAKEKAYDGKAKKRIFTDEIGKTSPTDEADVYKRHKVLKPCVFKNGKVWGKIYASTTVEELDEGGKEFKMLWDESRIDKKDDNGQTESGLYQYFLSALHGTFYDEYGYPVVEEPTPEQRDWLIKTYGNHAAEGSRKYYENKRAALKDKPNALTSEMRKFPFRPEEAFYADGESCEFNALVLTKRLEELEYKDTTTTGDFEWTNGIDTKVVFVPNPKGRWKVAWLPTDVKQTNMVEIGPTQFRHGKEIKTWRPLNDAKFRVGQDPVDMGLDTVEKRVSDTAMYVWMMFDVSLDSADEVFTAENCGGFDYKIGKQKWVSNRPICEYIAREDDPEASYEETIKAIRFFGCSVFPETNKQALRRYLIQRGYEFFLKYRPKETWTTDSGSQNTQGAASVEPIIQQYLTMIKSYVNTYGHLIPFKRLVKDLLNFRRSKIREHDATVALGFTLLATLGDAKPTESLKDLSGIFNKYRINGTQSELIR